MMTQPKPRAPITIVITQSEVTGQWHYCPSLEVDVLHPENATEGGYPTADAAIAAAKADSTVPARSHFRVQQPAPPDTTHTSPTWTVETVDSGVPARKAALAICVRGRVLATIAEPLQPQDIPNAYVMAAAPVMLAALHSALEPIYEHVPYRIAVRVMAQIERAIKLSRVPS